jgi:hypothetical protein
MDYDGSRPSLHSYFLEGHRYDHARNKRARIATIDEGLTSIEVALGAIVKAGTIRGG